MPFCTKCGSQVEEGQNFCSNCGCPIGGYQAQANAGAQHSASGGNSFADGVNGFINDIENTDDHSADYNPADISANRGVAVLAYIGILVIVPLIIGKDSPFARFHSNQGLVLLILEIICGIIGGVITGVFSVIHLGFIGSIITLIINVCLFALIIIGIVYAAQGKAKELPLIGKIKIIK